MTILGISAYYHDSAAAILVDGNIIAAAQEERFTRIKQDPGFPHFAIKYCLEEAALDLNQMDQIVFYDKPFLKFERLLETYYNFAPKGLISFLHAVPVWIREKLFLKRSLISGLKKVGTFNSAQTKILFTEHHLSHAASVFYPSPFKQATIVTIDGVGEWATASISMGHGSQIKVAEEMHFPHSVGLLYSAFTYYLGFKVNSGEYKLMGLAPYGNPNAEQTVQFIETIKSKLIQINEDGSIWLNQSYFTYATGLKMTNNKKWKSLFGIEKRQEEAPIEASHCNLAYAIQHVTEEVVLKIVGHAKNLAETPEQQTNLCLAGGVALNCVANGKIKTEGIFENIFIQPAAGDAGGALGAALATHYIYNNSERKVLETDTLSGSYLGPEFSSEEIKKYLRKNKIKATYFENFDALTKLTAQKINEGTVVGWFQGRMEFGPRALGNRSILGDARNPEMQKKLNLKIKYREGFRPFAPSVLAEDVQDYFDFEGESPYMLLVAPVKKERCKPVNNQYFSLPYMQRLYVQRSDLPAITHVDFSARLQTVHKNTNPRYWKLISDFKQITGYGVIVNTSFNVRGEPIVCTPEDAYRCFMRTEMDFLVLGNYFLDKHEQAQFEDTDWQNNMPKD